MRTSTPPWPSASPPRSARNGRGESSAVRAWRTCARSRGSPTRRRAGTTAGTSGLDQARDCLCRLVDRGPPLIAALPHRLRDTRVEMVFEQPKRDCLQRSGHRGDLSEHVDAVDVLLHHPLQPPDLALDPAQTLEVGVLVLRITAHAATIRACGTGRPYPLTATGGARPL